MDKKGLLDKIQRESEQWDRFLGEVGEERMEQPGATGEWAFKDVVAHLSAWRARALQKLEAARRDQTPSGPFWPAGLDEDNDDDLEEINNWIYEENHDRSLSNVLDESRQQFRHLRELVRSLSEEDLFSPDRYDWLEGKPLADMLTFTHFHEEHEPILRQWLAEQKIQN